MLQLNEFLPTETPPSRRKGKGCPYGDLAATAQNLSESLESRASTCESSSERRRLRVLSAAACQISECLRQTGVRLA
jgi:hypothetical protein